jgi:type IV secretory pathway VirB3-like protein
MAPKREHVVAGVAQLQCVAIGGVAMVLYLIAMGPMVPTKEILSKLRRNKR